VRRRWIVHRDAAVRGNERALAIQHPPAQIEDDECELAGDPETRPEGARFRIGEPDASVAKDD